MTGGLEGGDDDQENGLNYHKDQLGQWDDSDPWASI